MLGEAPLARAPGVGGIGTRSGNLYLPAGDPRPCRVCSHDHRVVCHEGGGARVVTFIAACPDCSCTAGEHDYDHGRPVVTARDLSDYFSVPGFPGHDIELVRVDDLDSDSARRLEPGRRVRGGWLDRLIRSCIPGFAGDQRDELVGERGDDSGDRDSADHGGAKDSTDATARDAVRGVVKEER